LDVRQMAKAAYRGHVKFEIVGLKKLIKAQDWAEIRHEIEHYAPLFEEGALPLDDFESYSDADIAEASRKELTKAFRKMDAIAQGEGGPEGRPATVEAATTTYFMIESLYSNVVRCYGSTQFAL